MFKALSSKFLGKHATGSLEASPSGAGPSIPSSAKEYDTGLVPASPSAARRTRLSSQSIRELQDEIFVVTEKKEQASEAVKTVRPVMSDEEFFATFLLPTKYATGITLNNIVDRMVRVRPPNFNVKTIRRADMEKVRRQNKNRSRPLAMDTVLAQRLADLKDKKALLEANFLLQATLQPADKLSRKMHEANDAQLDTNSVFQTSTPVVAALSKPRFQVLLLVAAVIFLGLGISAALSVDSTTSQAYSHFKFQVLSLRDGAVDPPAPNIERIGLLLQGCVLETPPGTFSASGPELLWSLPEQQAFNGWFFVTQVAAPDSLDPVRFAFFASNDLINWDMVGGSSWRFTASGGRAFLNRFYATTKKRGERVFFDLRPPWYWTMGRVVPDIIIALMLCATAYCGFRMKLRLGKVIFGNLWVASAAIWICSAIGEHYAGQTQFSFWWYIALACAVVFVTVNFVEQYFIQLIMCLCGMGCIFVAVLEYAAIIWNPVGFFVSLVTGLLLNILALALLLLRIKVVNEAIRMIEPDEARYAAAWQKVLESNAKPQYIQPQPTNRSGRSTSKKIVHPLLDDDFEGSVLGDPIEDSGESYNNQSPYSPPTARSTGPPLKLPSDLSVSRVNSGGIDARKHSDSSPRKGVSRVPSNGRSRSYSGRGASDVVQSASETVGAQDGGSTGNLNVLANTGSFSVVTPSGTSVVSHAHRKSSLLVNKPVSNYKSIAARSRREHFGFDTPKNSDVGASPVSLADAPSGGSYPNTPLPIPNTPGSLPPTPSSLPYTPSGKRSSNRMDAHSTNRNRIRHSIVAEEDDNRSDISTPRMHEIAEQMQHNTSMGKIRKAPDIQPLVQKQPSRFFSLKNVPSLSMIQQGSTQSMVPRSSPLYRLAQLCRTMAPKRQARGVAVKPMQYNRQVDTISGKQVPGALDYSKPVTSLDQLYAQARATDPFLTKKVQEWALQSRGMFPLERVLAHFARMANKTLQDDHETKQFIPWADAKEDPILCRRIKWGGVKRPHRAIEKALRSYSGNPAALLDICRKSIYYDHVEDIVSLMRVLSQDPHIVIERIKNRLDPAYDASQSAGYRDVAINLRIVNPQTIELGAETHVSELQLILLDFAMLKHESGHKRYVAFRNRKGE